MRAHETWWLWSQTQLLLQSQHRCQHPCHRHEWSLRALRRGCWRVVDRRGAGKRLLQTGSLKCLTHDHATTPYRAALVQLLRLTQRTQAGGEQMLGSARVLQREQVRWQSLLLPPPNPQLCEHVHAAVVRSKPILMLMPELWWWLWGFVWLG